MGHPRPWTIILSYAAQHGRKGNRRYDLGPYGRLLSAGPRGARGEFHYFDTSHVSSGQDAYHGSGVSARRAIRAAVGWLRRAGAAIPHAAPMVLRERTGSTYVGGTGICCFRYLDGVYWPGRPGRADLITAPLVVYVADAGTVVRVDRTRTLPLPTVPTLCLGRQHRDGNGVLIGSRCFDYREVSAEEMSTYLAGHHPEWGSQHLAAQSFTVGSRISAPYQLRVRTVRQSATTAVYQSRYRRTTYRLTLVAAFPALTHPWWELVNVEHRASTRQLRSR